VVEVVISNSKGVSMDKIFNFFRNLPQKLVLYMFSHKKGLILSAVIATITLSLLLSFTLQRMLLNLTNNPLLILWVMTIAVSVVIKLLPKTYQHGRNDVSLHYFVWFPAPIALMITVFYLLPPLVWRVLLGILAIIVFIFLIAVLYKKRSSQRAATPQPPPVPASPDASRTASGSNVWKVVAVVLIALIGYRYLPVPRGTPARQVGKELVEIEVAVVQTGIEQWGTEVKIPRINSVNDLFVNIESISGLPFDTRVNGEYIFSPDDKFTLPHGLVVNSIAFSSADAHNKIRVWLAPKRVGL
jgi:hypothetical protein